jgi:hypothetical protein
MPPIDKTKSELLELADRLQAISMVLRHVPLDHPASARNVEYLRKELMAIAAQLRLIPPPLTEG